jgi:hypothetical protein
MSCVYSYADADADADADTTQPTASNEGVVAMLDFVDDALRAAGAALVLWCPDGIGMDNDNFMALIESGETLGSVSDSAQFLRMISTRCDPTLVTTERYGARLLCYETGPQEVDAFADAGDYLYLWHGKGMR